MSSTRYLGDEKEPANNNCENTQTRDSEAQGRKKQGFMNKKLSTEMIIKQLIDHHSASGEKS